MSSYPDCYMCSDCGERVDEELSLPDGSCNWCNDET